MKKGLVASQFLGASFFSQMKGIAFTCLFLWPPSETK